jgi:hypothetical protein
MSDWKIGLTPQTTKGTPTIIGPLTALMAWKRLSKPARAAVDTAYPDGWIVCHPLTRKSLQRHGFIIRDHPTGWHLSDAGRAVAKWCVKP